MELPPDVLKTILATSMIEASKCRPRTSHEFDDLVQVGCEAALLAYPRWDPERSRWITFVTWRIRGGIRDYLRQQDPLTRRQRKAVRDGELEEAPVVLVRWIDLIDASVTDDYDKLFIDAELIDQVLRKYDGEAADAVREWFRRNGEWTQRQAAEAFGLHESAVSHGIKALLEQAPDLVDLDGD